MINKLKRYWFFILLAFMAVVLTVMSVLTSRSSKNSPNPVPTPTPSPTPYLQPAKIAGQPKYQFVLETPAREIAATPVYLSKPAEGDFQELLSQIKYQPRPISAPADAELIGQQFIQNNPSLFPQNDQYLVKYEYFLYAQSESRPAKDFAEAEIIDFLFFPRLNSLPIVSNFPKTGILDIWLNKSTGKIIKTNSFQASYENIPNQLTALIGYAEAQQKLEKSQGTIVYSGAQIAYSDAYQSLSSATITQAYLAYLQPQELPANLIPVWVFEGTAINTSGTVSPIVIYLPASK